MGRKKLLYKGGEKIDTTQGPFLPVFLKQKEPEIIEGLSKQFEEKATNLKFIVNQAQKDSIKEQELKARNDETTVKSRTLNEKLAYHIMQIFTKYLFGLMMFFRQIFIFIGTIFKEIINFLIKFFRLGLSVLNVGKGTVIRYICAIICIMAIFSIGFGIVKGFQKINPSFNNSVIDNILKTDPASFLTIKSPTFFSKFSNGLFSMIPDKYKYTFGSMTGSLNYMITGKNQFENYLEKRETIENDVGRSDNIFNINFKNNIGSYVSNKTYSILKPNDISIVFEGKNPSFDINKLSDNFKSQSYFGFYDKYTIPVVAPTANWILDVNNAYYSSNTLESDPESIKNIRIPANKQNNIFMINEKGQIIYNSFLNKNYYVETIHDNKISYITNYNNVINNLMKTYNIFNSPLNVIYTNIIRRLSVSNSYNNQNYNNIINLLDEKYKIDIY
jgi:hypothetical protein